MSSQPSPPEPASRPPSVAPDGTVDTQRRIYGYRGVQRWFVRLWLDLVGVILIIGGATRHWSTAALFLAMGVGLVLFVELRLLRVQVVVEDDVLRVRNTFRSYIIRWDQIVDVEQSLNNHYLYAIKLTDGRKITLRGVVPGLFGNRSRQVEPVQRLQAQIAAHREPGGSPTFRPISPGSSGTTPGRETDRR